MGIVVDLLTCAAVLETFCAAHGADVDMELGPDSEFKLKPRAVFWCDEYISRPYVRHFARGKLLLYTSSVSMLHGLTGFCRVADDGGFSVRYDPDLYIDWPTEHEDEVVTV